MFKIDKTDLSIHVTRGDSLFFGVKAKNESGDFYRFILGDLLRIKVYKKKNCSDVVVEKEFPVTIEGEEQQIYLSGTETKIGDVISKPTDYWYEVELNPYTDPQTVIGYDEDGARLFRLYPEGADKDGESISNEAQPPEKLEVLTGAVVNPEVIRGMSAYEIAVMHGFEGTEEEWLESLTEQTKLNAAEVIAEADKQIGLMNEAGEAGKSKVKSAEDEAVAHIAGLAEGAYDIVQTTGDSETAVMSQKATTEALKINRHRLVGGSIEDWSSVEYTPNSGTKYNVIIYPFAVRSWLTSGYILWEVRVYNTDGTSSRIGYDSVANYDGTRKVISVDNTAGNITKVEVKLRPETDTEAFVTFVDVTEQNALGEQFAGFQNDLDRVKPYFKRSEVVADFTNNTLNATYQSVMLKLDAPIAVGETVTFKIDAPNGDENSLYINLYNGTDRVHNLGIASAIGSRKVVYTNTKAKEITHIEPVLLKVLQKNSYTITIYDENSIPDKVDYLVETVENIASGAAQIPEYYKIHLKEAINRAKTNMLNAGVNGETFAFISDLHWESNAKNSPALIGAITDELPIENVIFGGDAINGGTYESAVENMNDIRKRFVEASKRFLSIYGNHDSNALDGGTAFTKREFYTLLQKQSDYYAVHEAPSMYYYFYMDNPTTRTRMIFLDSGQQNPSYAGDEMGWLQRTINNTPSGYNIIVFCHVIYAPSSGGSYGDPTTWEMTTFMTDVCNYLDTLTNVNVKAIFGGHSHYDYATETAGGIPIVLIDCDAQQTQTGVNQATGTVNEQAFDIVTVNYKTNTIHCTRVGRGADRTI